MFEQLMVFAQSNQQVAAALTLVVGAALSWVARDIPMRIWRFISSQSTCKIELDNTNDWNGSNARMERFMAWYIENGITWMSRSMRMTAVGDIEPGWGSHYFIYRRRLFWFYFEELDSQGVHFRKRILRITALTRNEALVREFVETITREPDDVKTHVVIREPLVFTDHGDINWQVMATLPIIREYRPLVNGEVYKSIHDLITRYEDDKEWFTRNNAPFKRTLLLSGPPGTGKSTLAMQIAMITGRDVYLPGLGRGQTLPLWMSTIPKGSIIIFEDIHSNYPFLNQVAYTELVNESERNTRPLPYGAVTDLTTFLNVLNGPVPLQDQIVIMTTNYRERLEPAIYRPGRVDLDLHVGYLTDQDIYDWLSRTYGDEFDKFYPYELKFRENLTTGEVFQQYEIHRDDFHTMVLALQGMAEPDLPPMQETIEALNA